MKLKLDLEKEFVLVSLLVKESVDKKADELVVGWEMLSLWMVKH